MLNDGSCVRLRPEHANHVWSYDFVSAKTDDGRTVRMLNLIDEHTRECLLVRLERQLVRDIGPTLRLLINCKHLSCGGMCEWLKQAVLKTA
jgi:hypothetical protein